MLIQIIIGVRSLDLAFLPFSADSHGVQTNLLGCPVRHFQAAPLVPPIFTILCQFSDFGFHFPWLNNLGHKAE